VEPGGLEVHVAQANNESSYAFVRAKFRPCEVADPWAVRFFDDQGTEVPYFVWDSITWKTAREGRADWGRQYALINHAPGNEPEVIEARARKLEWAKKKLPELGERLEAEEQAAAKAGDSICAAIYLLRRQVAPFARCRTASGIAISSADLAIVVSPAPPPSTCCSLACVRYFGYDG
jgi:hypothetical protein